MNQGSRIKIFALGGLSESGKNMTVVEIDEDIFVIDAGMKYPSQESKGIDLVLPDYTYLKDNKDRVKAYILTHGHDDVIGAINYIVRDVPAPIVCTDMTKHLLELSNRKYSLKARHSFTLVRPTTTITIAKRNLTLFKTTHSIFDSFGVAIETDQGYIIYTGDYIMDYGAPGPYSTDLKTLSNLASRDVLCLMIESSGAKERGSASPNHHLTPHIERTFQEIKSTIFIAMYDNNFYGIGEVIELAIRCNKKIYFQHTEMRELVQKMIEHRVISIPPMTIISTDEAMKQINDDLVVFVTGGGTSVFRALERISGGDPNPTELSLKETDTIILAAHYNSGNEVVAIKAINDVYRTGARVVDLRRKKVAGMHPRVEDIKMVLSMLKPKYYMPIKGEYSNLIANAQIAIVMGYNHSNILVYDNGHIAQFQKGRLMPPPPPIPAGDLLVDGLGIGDVGSVVIADREKISNEGVLVIATSVSKKNREIVTTVDTQARGLVFVRDTEEILDAATKIFVDTLTEFLKGENEDFNIVKMEIREKIVRMVKREIGKEPMVLPVIIEL